MLSFDLAWVGLCIAIILFVRDLRLLFRNRVPAVTTRRPFVATRSPAVRARRSIGPARGRVASRRPVGEFPPTPRTIDDTIAAWRHTVKPEDAPLLSQIEDSQVGSDYTPSEFGDIPIRSASPVSTVANWSTVTGTPSLGQTSVAPPPYSEHTWTARYADD